MNRRIVLIYHKADSYHPATWDVWWGRKVGNQIHGIILDHDLPVKPTKRVQRKMIKAEKARWAQWGKKL